MGTPKTPETVRLVIGLLSQNLAIETTLRQRLQEQFGPEDAALPPFPFPWTQYYQEELGSQPWRSIVAYELPIDRIRMPEIKLFTNQLEDEYATDGLRTINIDPGYLTLGQFFLATTKDQRQRVYVRDGIYIEPTLFFQGGNWHAFPWTYRDWQSPPYLQFLHIARERFAYQRSKGRPWRLRATS